MPRKRIGFYVELPVKTVREIKRRATLNGRRAPHWEVVNEAIMGTKLTRKRTAIDLKPNSRPKTRTVFSR